MIADYYRDAFSLFPALLPESNVEPHLLLSVRISLYLHRNWQKEPAEVALEVSSHWEAAELADKRIHHSELPGQGMLYLLSRTGSPLQSTFSTN